MNYNYRWLCIVMMVVCTNISSVDHSAGDPLHSLLFPPELLMQHRREIGLTDEQVEQIRARFEAAGPKAREHQMCADTAMSQLAELLSAEKIDEEAVLAQLDAVLAIEKDQKHLHLRLMIQTRNDLSSEQRQVATRLKQVSKSNEGLVQRLQAKISRIEKEVRLQAEAGTPPSSAIGLMLKFPELMKNGQVEEAEVVLDRAIKILGLDNANGAASKPRPAVAPNLAAKIRQIQRGAQKMQQSGKDVSKIQALMNQLPPLMEQQKTEEAEKLIEEVLELINEDAVSNRHPARSTETVRAEVDALKKEGVAWRGIDWKTCLLDGLAASQEQDKPIMLWVSIDRPTDRR